MAVGLARVNAGQREVIPMTVGLTRRRCLRARHLAAARLDCPYRHATCAVQI